MGGRPQIRKRSFVQSVSKYYAPYSGPDFVLDTGPPVLMWNWGGGRRDYKPPCKLVATLGLFRYGNDELEAWGTGAGGGGSVNT